MHTLTEAMSPLLAGAEIEEHPLDGGIAVTASWPWPSDERRSRRTSTLRIEVSREIVDDFNALGAERRATAMEHLVQALRHRLKHFNAHENWHDNPRHIPPPIVRWAVAPEEMHL
jgi:hypothetical protein